VTADNRIPLCVASDFAVLTIQLPGAPLYRSDYNLVCQPYTAQQILKTWVAAKWIEAGVHLK